MAAEDDKQRQQTENDDGPVDPNLNVSIITLNVSNLNTSITRQTVRKSPEPGPACGVCKRLVRGE